MATFNKDVVLYTNPILIREIADQIQREFSLDGYDVKKETLSSGGVDISLSKGGTFKAVLGMKTALKITLTPQSGSIHFEAKVGIFGQQFIPTLIMWFYLWPVIVTQIWGLVQQAKLDDKALAIANSVIAQHRTSDQQTLSGATKFCSRCGNQLEANAQFCPSCGNKA